MICPHCGRRFSVDDDFEKPNPNIKPPEYMVFTEGFDPGKVGKLIKILMEKKNRRKS